MWRHSLPVLLCLAGCSPFGAASDALEGGAETGAGDAGEPDATSDGGTVDAGPCAVRTVLVGSDVINGGAMDIVPQNGIDAYGYGVVASGTARCAYVYLPSKPAGGAVTLGVYTSKGNPGAEAPDGLVARATFVNPGVGWSSVQLESDLAVHQGDVLWLGLDPPNSAMSDWIMTACSTSLVLHAATNVPSALPIPFVTQTTYPNACNAAIFLGP